ncbi:TonB-dependent receptor [uncultured Porphyromonas sp.]|uniref:TonB-dependent receptor plug domain-containing protein n=1 Tax=uncultured Porphyromonas sp. TaxID=159274 RepID=UPI0026187818|nr:TonB-dependent receptor [uncultured Porphyromonas sp.]
MVYRPLLILFALLWSFTPSLSAQSKMPDSIAHDHTLEDVVVTGTQTPRTLKKLPIITQVISRKDLERLNPRSATDALQMSMPGINVTTHGAQSRVTVQGFSGDHILFLVDGERLTSEGNGVVDLNRIDLSSIERIEVVRGAASALYGSNAIGGVINFITKRARAPHEYNLSYDYSGEGISRYNGSAQLRRGGFSSLTSANYTDQSAYHIGTSSLRRESTPVLGSKSLNLTQTLRYRSSDLSNELYGYLRYGHRDQDGNEVSRNQYRSHSFGGRAYHAFSDLHNLRLDYNHELYHRYRDSIHSGKQVPIFDFTGQTIRLQYNYGAEGRSPVLVNTGVEVLLEELRGDKFSSATTRHRAQFYTLYGQGEWHILPQLSAVGGFRMDVHSTFGSHFSPRASLLYSLKNVRLRASYSEGFRSPSIKEQYMDWDHLGMFFIKGTKGLRPEVSRMISLSPEWQTSHFNLTGIASYSLIYNQIGSLFVQDENAYHYTNIGTTTRLLNLQTSLRAQLPWGFAFNGDYSYIHDFSKAEDRANGQPFAPLRPHNYTANLSYERKASSSLRLSATYSLRGAGGVTLSEYNSLSQAYTYVQHEGFLLSRISLAGQYKGRLRLTLGLDNLFDHHPDQVNITGSLSPGRTFFGSISYTL